MTIAKSLTAIRNTTSRRKFLAGAALAGAGVIAMPQVSRAQTVTLKMQSSWGPKDIFQDMARQYTDRVDAMSGGRRIRKPVLRLSSAAFRTGVSGRVCSLLC